MGSILYERAADINSTYLRNVVGQEGLDVEHNPQHSVVRCGGAVVDGFRSVEAEAIEAGELPGGGELLALRSHGYELKL